MSKNKKLSHKEIDTDMYLKRIGYQGSLEPTAETLRQLHVAHMLAVPFENLSIHSGERIILDDKALFEKIVLRKRGGFCYELNGLFANLLRTLGFSVEMLSAGVMNKKGQFGPDFDHMMLLVTLEDRWLVDVGFGDSFVEPLLLDNRTEQAQRNRTYRIDDSDGKLVLLQNNQKYFSKIINSIPYISNLRPSGWKKNYRFDLNFYEYEDYIDMCNYQQDSPESVFTKEPFCSILTKKGRITINKKHITITKGNKKYKKKFHNQEDYYNSLRDYGGICLNKT